MWVKVARKEKWKQQGRRREWKERLRMLRPRSQTAIRQRNPSPALRGLAKKRTLQIASTKPLPENPFFVWNHHHLPSFFISFYARKFFASQSLRHEDCRIIPIFGIWAVMQVGISQTIVPRL